MYILPCITPKLLLTLSSSPSQSGNFKRFNLFQGMLRHDQQIRTCPTKRGNGTCRHSSIFLAETPFTRGINKLVHRIHSVIIRCFGSSFPNFQIPFSYFVLSGKIFCTHSDEDVRVLLLFYNLVLKLELTFLLSDLTYRIFYF